METWHNGEEWRPSKNKISHYAAYTVISWKTKTNNFQIEKMRSHRGIASIIL